MKSGMCAAVGKRAALSAAFLVSVMTVVDISNGMAQRPWTDGVSAGMAASSASTSCGAGKICINVRTTNTCNDGGTAICGPYTPGGTASQAAGIYNTYGGPTIAGEIVYSGGERMYNNTNSGRPACAYYNLDFYGGDGYRRANVGTGWNIMPFTGAGSIAAIPTTTGWVCWS